jgi:hypothetical protein
MAVRSTGCGRRMPSASLESRGVGGGFNFLRLSYGVKGKFPLYNLEVGILQN